MKNQRKSIEKVGEKGMYIKSPRPYNKLDGDFTVMQTRTLVRLAEELNPRMDKQLDSRVVGGSMGMLFGEEEFSEGIVRMSIPISTFGVKPKDYPDIKRACEDLANTKVYENYVDDNGTTHWKTINVFHSIDYTTTTDGRRNVNFEIVRNMAERLFTMSHGFSEYSKRITSLSRNSRAIRLYIRLSNARSNGFEKIPYVELKRYFGTIETAPNDPDKILKDKYKLYSHFKRHILEPIRTELDKLVRDGNLDFSFEYEEINDTPKRKSADPDYIKFTLIPPFTKAIEVKAETKSEQSSPMYFKNSRADYLIIKQLADKGSEWANEMLSTDHAYDQEYVDTMERLVKEYGISV